MLSWMQDATLPHTIDKRIFLAANLKDNEELMPHFILQLLLSIAAMHRDAVFISVYESGSTDLTGAQHLNIFSLCSWESSRRGTSFPLIITHSSPPCVLQRSTSFCSEHCCSR